MLFQWVLLKLSAVQKTVKLLWVAYLSYMALKSNSHYHDLDNHPNDVSYTTYPLYNYLMFVRRKVYDL